MKTALDPRHTRRQQIVQEIFAWNANSSTKPADEKTKQIIEGIDEVDNLVRECAPEWEIDKINPIDLAILRLGIFELAFEHKEPPKVVIDEAIELGKEFGNESSPAFVNGALGKALSSPTRITRLIADKFGVEMNKVTPEANLKADLNATDLEIADLITMTEQDLGLPIAKTDHIETVGDILEMVEDQI